MIATQMDYVAPDSLNAVLALIGQHGGRVLTADAALARTTDRPAGTWVSLRKVAGLATVHQDAGAWRIGALASYAELAHSGVGAQYPVLAQALAAVSEPHWRNHGNISSALHAGGAVHAPVLAALMALDASAVLQSQSGPAQVPLQSFSEQGRRVPLAGDKLLYEVVIAQTQTGSGSYLALEQLSGRAPARGIAVMLRLAGQTVADVRLVLAGFTEQPLRLSAVEAALKGQPLSAEAVAQAAAQLSADHLFLTGAAGVPDYLTQLAKVLVRRALLAVNR